VPGPELGGGTGVASIAGLFAIPGPPGGHPNVKPATRGVRIASRLPTDVSRDPLHRWTTKGGNSRSTRGGMGGGIAVRPKLRPLCVLSGWAPGLRPICVLFAS
jgi:hypothetical protein